MYNILPVLDFKKHNEGLNNCSIDASGFLMKNDRERFVVCDIEDYERERAE